MASSLSNLIDNLTEGIHKIKCRECGCSLEYESVWNNLIKYKCLTCNKNYSNKLDEELRKKFKKTFKFFKNNINKFILLLSKKEFLTNKWMIGESLIKQYYPKKKKEFHSNLNLEDITDAD